MKSIARRFAAVLIVPVAFACAEKPADDGTVAGDTTTVAPAATAPAELTAAAERYAAAWNAKDPAAIAAFFTEDAVATVGDSTWRGVPEITRGWLAAHAPGVSNLVVTTTSMAPMGSDYHGQGTYTLTATPPAGAPGAGVAVPQTGRFDVMWTQAADGQWKIKTTDVQADSIAQ